MTPQITITNDGPQDTADTLIGWAKSEGWNPGLNDADLFCRADPRGWWIAKTEDGTPVGGLSLVHSDDRRFAFLGLYIVHPDWRGKGIGLRIWNTALEQSPALCIGLDGVPAQQDNYTKSGFSWAFKSERFAFSRSNIPSQTIEELVPLEAVPFGALCALDRAAAYPGPRTTFLKDWRNQNDAIGLGLIRDGDLIGYGVVRSCHDGHKIGPLVAPGQDEALGLLHALCTAAGVKDGYWDVPHINAEALSLARDLGLQGVFETARMYKGTPEVDLDLNRLWGVTTFELG